jgi:hypothetical protein
MVEWLGYIVNKNCLGSFQVLWNKTAPPRRMILGFLEKILSKYFKQKFEVKI